MDACAQQVVEEPAPDPAIVAVAVRMADEGIPIRAIARSTRVSSEEVYELLRQAIQSGTIIELPKDDWPAGSTRGTRSPFNGTPLDDEDRLKVACTRYFKATKLEAALLAVLLRRDQATKDQLHRVIEQNRPGEKRDETDPKMVDVLICHLRKKLRPHDVQVETIWGVGYAIPVPSRDKAVRALIQMGSLAYDPDPMSGTRAAVA